MCRLLLSMNRYIDEQTLINFFDQSIQYKNTPGISNKFDSNFHLDGYGLAWVDNKYNLCVYHWHHYHNIYYHTIQMNTHPLLKRYAFQKTVVQIHQQMLSFTLAIQH